MDDREIIEALDELDKYEEYCKANPIIEPPPSTFAITMMGASDNAALRFLYSSGLDHMVDKFLDLVIQGGSIEELLTSDEMFVNMMAKMGFDSSKLLNGVVSKTLIQAIDKTMESRSYIRTKSKMRKVVKVFHAMDRGAKTIKDKALREKYQEAARAVKQVIKFVGKIYKNRRLVDERVRKGLAIALNEDAVSREELPMLYLEAFEMNGKLHPEIEKMSMGIISSL